MASWITRRLPFLCIDARWKVFWKNVWTPFAGPNEGYWGYHAVWDTIPWQIVHFGDGIPRDHNFASPAQYRPAYGGDGDYYGVYDDCIRIGFPEHYCHDCCGLVQDIIALLEADGIAEETLDVAYHPSPSGNPPVSPVKLRDIFFRNFDPANKNCSICFSRPQDYKFAGIGHLGDNNQKEFFCRSEISCDGTEGLRLQFPGELKRAEFFADAMHFVRIVSSNEIKKHPPNAHLILYILACSSVPRIAINGHFFVIEKTPAGEPDPYRYHFRGKKIDLGLLASLPLNLDDGEPNEFVVENLSVRSDQVGCQVIFAIEYKAKEDADMAQKKPRKGMAFGDIVDRWDLMVKEVARVDLQTDPHMKNAHDALEADLAQAFLLNEQQESLKGQLASVTAQLEELLFKTGHAHYNSLYDLLRAKYGRRSPELKRYVPAAEGEVDKTKGDFKKKPEQPPK